MAPRNSLETSLPLAASGTWTGGWLARTEGTYSIEGTVFADVDGTLHIEQSSDGANADVDTSYEIKGSDGKGFKEALVGRFWRLRFVNGAKEQKAFRISGTARRGS